MRRALSNWPIALLVAVFTLSSTALLHADPFGGGEVAWPIALAIVLAINLFFAYVIAPWAAPYLASTGGRQGAAMADPRAVVVAERWTAGTLLLFGSLGLLAVTLASKQVVVTPTERLEQNAELVRHTVELHAPEQYQAQLGGADTWKLSPRTYRTCVPSPGSLRRAWCVLIRVDEDGGLRVASYGPGLSNAAQALKWHPEWQDRLDRAE